MVEAMYRTAVLWQAFIYVSKFTQVPCFMSFPLSENKTTIFCPLQGLLVTLEQHVTSFGPQRKVQNNDKYLVISETTVTYKGFSQLLCSSVIDLPFIH